MGRPEGADGQDMRVLCILSAALGLLLATPSLAAAAQMGTVPDITWGASRADIDRTISLMREANVRTVRLHMSWKGLEPNAKGAWNTGWLAELDYAVAETRKAGLHVVMGVFGPVPYWASADPAKYTDGSTKYWKEYYRPTRNEDFADYARFLVERYRGQGVHDFEVWNEPNHTAFWPSGPNATEYTALLRTAQPAIKRADPQARVVLGGLSGNDYNFLAQLYAAGAGPWFDVAAVHPYVGAVDPTRCWNQSGTTRYAKEAFCGLEEVRRTMVDNGDANKKLWLTEFGWSTSTGTYGVSEAQQAEFLGKAIAKIQTLPYVEKVHWYNFRNWGSNDPASLNGHFGLLRKDFSPKPAFAVFKTAAAATASAASVSDASGDLFPAKLEVSRLTVDRGKRVLDLVAPLTARASGTVEVGFRAAGRSETFQVPVDADGRGVRIKRSITAAQARLGSGIVTIDYPGNARTRPQQVRLRAAANPARLDLDRPSIRDGRLQATGTVTRRARGVVRVLIEFHSGGRLHEYTTRARIAKGAWKLDERLPADVRQAIEERDGSVHSYTAFTGYLPERIRGEFESFEVAVAG